MHLKSDGGLNGWKRLSQLVRRREWKEGGGLRPACRALGVGLARGAHMGDFSSSFFCFTTLSTANLNPWGTL